VEKLCGGRKFLLRDETAANELASAFMTRDGMHWMERRQKGAQHRAVSQSDHANFKTADRA
jgi:hypothetical protein